MDTQALVARAQAGDGEAFRELYELFAPKVYRYLCCNLNGRSHLAEDLAQEVFMKVLEKLRGYRDLGLPFSAWLFRIAHNHLIDYLRGQPNAASASIDDLDSLAEQRGQSIFDRVLTHSELLGAMAGLTEAQRQVITLRFMEGLTLDETSRIIGRTEDAAKKLQARGLQAMKTALTAYREASSAPEPTAKVPGILRSFSHAV